MSTLVRVEFCATLDLAQGSAAITIKVTDLYAQPPPVAPEVEFDYDYDPTQRTERRPVAITQEVKP